MCSFNFQQTIGGEKKTININNFAGWSWKWVGVKLFMCFPFSWGKRETHKQNSQEISGKGRESPGIIPGQSRENFVYVFACLLVFPCPETRVYPYPLGAGSARPNPKMGAPDPENPVFLGFSVLRGLPRPWSQTMVSEGARPWGRGRSGDYEF